MNVNKPWRQDFSLKEVPISILFRNLLTIMWLCGDVIPEGTCSSYPLSQGDIGEVAQAEGDRIMQEEHDSQENADMSDSDKSKDSDDNSQ